MELVFIWLFVKGKNAQECSSFVCENNNVKKDVLPFLFVSFGLFVFCFQTEVVWKMKNDISLADTFDSFTAFLLRTFSHF